MKASKYDVFKKITSNINDWKFTHFTAEHKSGVQYWIANGLVCFCITPESKRCPIGIINKIALWYWLKNAQRQKILEK